MALALATAGPASAQDPVLNSGDTGWLLSATALVLFMTLPGLALFYAGLVRSKNVLSVMMHCVAIACLASVLWLAAGYSLAFSGTGPVIGDLMKAGLANMPRGALTGTVPESVFFGFQIQTGDPHMGATVAAVMFLIILSGVMLYLFGVQRRVQRYEF
jgi:Amt family ammonium transporter